MSEKRFKIDQPQVPAGKKEISPGLKEKIAKAEDELATIAQIVGGDFGMKVKFGEQGGGSFYNLETVEITLDPDILLEGKDWLAQFVAGHEGGHRAITRSLEQVGVPEEKALELYGKIGFGYSVNCREDCADNDWVGGIYEKFKEASDKNYQETFAKPDAVMATLEIQTLISLLGYVPKFVRFGGEVMRRWAIDEQAEGLDKEVVDALKATAGHEEKYWQTIPEKYAKELERVERARDRFRIFYEKIWPEVEKLVKMDIDQEKMRQLAQELLKQAQEKGESGKAGEPGASSGGAGQLPKELLDELQKAAEKNLKKQLEELGKQLDELKKKLETAGSEEEKKKISEQMEKLLADKLGLQNGGTNAVPWDKLSPELKKKLQELYNKLPKETREKLEKQARETLEELDDAMIIATRGKLSKDGRPLTHEEAADLKKLREEEASDRTRRKKKREEDEADSRRIQEEIQARMEGELSEYDRIYKDVAPLVDELYSRIHKVFLPQRHPQWIKGKPTGQKLDLAKVMQFQADRTLYDKLWEQKTIPKKNDYKFTLLNDLSGSMQGAKIEQDFRAKVVVAEVLNRLGIGIQILGFQDEVIMFKDFEGDLSPTIRQKMLVMRKEPFNRGNHNKASWNSDGYCVSKASEMLDQQKGKNNFLLVLSDGLPAPDSKHAGAKYDLHTVVAAVRKKTKQKLVGLGIGPGTEHVKNFYPTSLPSLPLKDMPRLLGDLLEDMIKFPGKYQ